MAMREAGSGGLAAVFCLCGRLPGVCGTTVLARTAWGDVPERTARVNGNFTTLTNCNHFTPGSRKLRQAKMRSWRSGWPRRAWSMQAIISQLSKPSLIDDGAFTSSRSVM